MNKHPENTNTERKCFRCEKVLPATKDYFYGDKGRPLGLSYECKACMSKRKVGRDRRKERWANLSPERKEKVKARQFRYNRTNKGRAIFLRKAYQRIDSCNLTSEEVRELIDQPCFYCGTDKVNRGLDRIDNALGHDKGNVLPCCVACNCARNNFFSVEEMLVIGRAIRSIWDERAKGNKPYPTRNAVRL